MESLIKENTMTNRGDRIMKSNRARKRRKTVKQIKETLTKRYYAHMRHLKEKYQKIKQKHHDNKLD